MEPRPVPDKDLQAFDYEHHGEQGDGEMRRQGVPKLASNQKDGRGLHIEAVTEARG